MAVVQQAVQDHRSDDLLFASKSLENTAFMPLSETAQMRLLVDECTGPAVAHWLRAQGHEVFSVFEQARGMADDQVLNHPPVQPRAALPYQAPRLAIAPAQACRPAAWQNQT